MKSVIASVAALGLLASTVSATPVAFEGMQKRNNGDGSKGRFSDYGHSTMDPMGNTTLAPYPTYKALTDFDYASFLLGLYQEYIEYDLFHYGLVRFTPEEFEEAGINADQQSLLLFMANQESGHATLISDILGLNVDERPAFCTYNYSGAFSNVREYVDFNQKLTRWGESGVWGFLGKLNSRDSATLLSQSIATEARQQMIFRQWTGSQPMPVWFESGIPQTWQWTLLAPYIQSCPTNSPRIMWSAYPALRVDQSNTLVYNGSQADISTNRTTQLGAGSTIKLSWDEPGKTTGPDGAYTTAIESSGKAKYAVIVSQLNNTFIELENFSGNSATVTLPQQIPSIYENTLASSQGILNGTSFIALTDEKMFLTPFNFTLINKHVVAGPSILQMD